MAVERAREKARLVLKVAQTYLNDHMSIRDENLLFEISEVVLLRDIITDMWGWSWKAKRKPYVLKIGEKVKVFINKAEIHYKVAKNFDKKLLSRYQRAVYWTGTSIETEELDHKIIDLCIALEALLTSENDKKKGEVIETSKNIKLMQSHFKLFEGKWSNSILGILEDKLRNSSTRQ